MCSFIMNILKVRHFNIITHREFFITPSTGLDENPDFYILGLDSLLRERLAERANWDAELGI